MIKKNMIIAIVALLIVLAAGFWYFYFFAHACNAILPKRSLSIDGHTWTVEMATTMAQQACGLSGRDGLGVNDGMLFIFRSTGVQNFWMKDMKFSIDMIWISGDKVAGFAEGAAPQPGAPLWKLNIYTSPSGVDKVLEVNAGTVVKDNIKIGDIVTTSP